MPKHTTNNNGGEDGKGGRVLVSGSFCYDVIADCCGGLDAAAAGAVFFAPNVRRVFGGCGGNIAYGLAQLGDVPLLMTAAGRDFGDYRAHLAKHNIVDDYIMARDDCWTATAFVINDEGGGQMTVFHPGASVHAHEQSPMDIDASFSYAIVSPNAGEAMMKHSRDLAKMNVPFIFDPGQALGLLNAGELIEALTMCACAIFNGGEFLAALKTMDVDEGEVVKLAGAVVITKGEDGSRLLLHDGDGVECAAAMIGKTADTTGCGDAYRAGLLHGMIRGWGWRQRMEFAAVIAGIKAQGYGGQGYETSADEVEDLRRKIFVIPA